MIKVIEPPILDVGAGDFIQTTKDEWKEWLAVNQLSVEDAKKILEIDKFSDWKYDLGLASRKVELYFKSQENPNTAIDGEYIQRISTPSVDTVKDLTIFDPNKSINYVRSSSDLIRTMLKDSILIPEGKDQNGHTIPGDYGSIAGSQKPALFKSGAEKLCAAFSLSPTFESLTDSVSDWSSPFFYFHYKCKLYKIGSMDFISESNGSCNSKEDKYGWRWVSFDKLTSKYKSSIEELETRIGKISEFDFAIDKAETTGQYGKPEKYWQDFRDAINNGIAMQVKKKSAKGKEFTAYEIDTTTYRIPNPDVYSIVNTIDKMAQKRALVAACLIGTAASLFFTQDIEDMPNFGTVN